MLFHSSIRKELARSFGATLIVLVTVVMTMTLIRTLGQASRGSFNPSDVMLVMGYNVLAFLPNIMTMGLFVATVGTLSRLYRDSEMVIWFSSGVGLWNLLAPLMRFAWPILLAIATLALFVLLPLLLRQGLGFWLSLGLASAATVVCYLAMLPLLRKFGVQL